VLSKVLEGWGYPNVEEQEISAAIANMYAVSQKHWHVETDTITTLESVKKEGFQTGIISNAADDQDVQTLIDQAGIRPYFDFILTSAAEGIRKPDTYIFQKALDFRNVKPSRAVMVGDTLNADILGANRAGIFSVWIKRRVEIEKLSAAEKKVQPDAAITTLEELPGLLKDLSW
jgi:HAD superfamily hydrolase (TIGR01662 family)